MYNSNNYRREFYVTSLAHLAIVCNRIVWHSGLHNCVQLDPLQVVSDHCSSEH